MKQKNELGAVDIPKTKSKGIYQSPLSILFERQQPKVRAKRNMSNFLLTYAQHDPKRIARLLQKWIEN